LIVSKSDKEYEPYPVGLVPAICMNYFDVGLQHGYNGKVQHKLVVLWELEARRSDGKHFTVTKKYTACLEEKANLTKDLVSWRGVAFTAAELRGFNLDAIKGKPCLLNLVQKSKQNGDPFVEVSAIARADRSWRPFQVETAPDYIPDWVAGLIESQLKRPAPDPARRDTPVDGRAEYQRASYSSPRSAPDGYDDIPF